MASVYIGFAKPVQFKRIFLILCYQYLLEIER